MKESASGALNQEVDISRTGDRDSVRLLEDLEDLEERGDRLDLSLLMLLLMLLFI